MEIFADIVGTHFRGSEAKQIVNNLNEGDEVQLVREPDNQYDANAVACYVDDVHVGYIPAANNLALALALDDGEEATAEVIGFNGNKPTLMIQWAS
jgi:hypothetical protein